ncbi:NAD(P)/FAD-dependent oxidoreductase [Candidatus Pelagibacter sp. RS39]|uniref:NAD(P)/FAD-dependent oxidoreductase n=1 Tax=Candidatus Pelagibacter sp. RS39 TaxID=1977864 RepID=UPI000A16364A|nr:FAD-binding oxidoreductase [Candidatus Pelagibacter sp. RS39]ARJ47731.1 amino acid oxidase [Candidatus Pelagibacter sp. RS39]
MEVVNDNCCSWVNDLNPRTNIQTISSDLSCEWLVVGAGYTGLSAARKLGQLYPNQKILLVDAQLAGEGASSRNSGYLVDTTLNDGFTSNKELDNYKKKADIYKIGIEAVKKFIKEYQVDCDWNECGKYFASSNIKDKKILENFSDTLSKLGFEHNLIFKNVLTKRLGTNFYNVALYTKGGILLHPGKLVRAMVDTLPENVILYENSLLLNWKKIGGLINCNFRNGSIKSKRIIFATNGFLKSLGIKSNYNFPITLTASMTRPLTEKEFTSIGEPKEWGVLPVRPMGATIRMTKDRRILIRNTAEVYNPYQMSKSNLEKRSIKQKIGIKKRFPQLPDDIIQSTWSGIVSRTRNSSQIFEKIQENIFVAGCYNGSGIGVGTLFGEQIAIKASNENTKEIETIEARSKPTWLPPQPFLNLGIKARLMYERLRAKSEI